MLADPRLLPHRIDRVLGRLTLVPTTGALLRQASFLDGRSEFGNGTPRTLPLAQRVEVSGPDRFVFHTAFCGSTLLTRLLDRAGAVLALREPQCLIDLADWHAAGVDAQFGPALELAAALLRRRWQPGEAVVVKPTNWCNNLVPALLAPGRDVRAVFVTMDLPAFLRAVFRGGSERLAMTARTAVHLAQGDDSAQLAAILGSGAPQFDTLAIVAAFAHHLQTRMFAEARRGMEAPMLTLDDIAGDPSRTVAVAQAALDLELAELDPAVLARHAKGDAAYSSAARVQADACVEVEYSRHIDVALTAAAGWA